MSLLSYAIMKVPQGIGKGHKRSRHVSSLPIGHRIFRKLKNSRYLAGLEPGTFITRIGWQLLALVTYPDTLIIMKDIEIWVHFHVVIINLYYEIVRKLNTIYHYNIMNAHHFKLQYGLLTVYCING